jgi:hypothetical protein
MNTANKSEVHAVVGVKRKMIPGVNSNCDRLEVLHNAASL